MLSDSSQNWTDGEFAGLVIANETDGSQGVISSNTATTITASLAGGAENDWDPGDSYVICATRIMSDAYNDFSMFGPWGLVGMPAMVDRVTSLDMSVWHNGGTLDDLFERVDFSGDVPPVRDSEFNGDRYSVAVDNRISFDPARPNRVRRPARLGRRAIHDGDSHAQRGRNPRQFPLRHRRQMSVLSEHLAFALGLDTNGDGDLEDEAQWFETVGGVGGQITVPVLYFDELRLPTEEGVDLVWIGHALPGHGHRHAAAIRPARRRPTARPRWSIPRPHGDRTS